MRHDEMNEVELKLRDSVRYTINIKNNSYRRPMSSSRILLADGRKKSLHGKSREMEVGIIEERR